MNKIDVEKGNFKTFTELESERLKKELTALECINSTVNDNRDLKDLDCNQKMDTDEVLDLKKGGESSELIIDKLVKNSVTFDKKTSWSKEKYVKFKQERHSLKFRVLKATSRSIGHVLWTRTRISGQLLFGLRPIDTLPLMLYNANICPFSKVLVMESVSGFLLGSILEKLNGMGEVFTTFIGPTPATLTFLKHFNFTEEQLKPLYSCDLGKLLTGKAGDEHLEIIEAARIRREENQTSPEDIIKLNEWKQKKEEDKTFFRRQKFAFTTLRETKVDSLIICHKAEPNASFFKLYPYLKNGGKFVVFSAFVDPLTLLKEEVQKKSLGLNVKVQETFLRKYKIGSGSTHPEMRMDGASGFLLTGIKIEA